MAENGSGHQTRSLQSLFAGRNERAVCAPSEGPSHGFYLSAQPISNLQDPEKDHLWAEVFGHITGIDPSKKEYLFHHWEQHADPQHMQAFDRVVVRELSTVLARRPEGFAQPVTTYAANLSMITLQSTGAVDELIDIVKSSGVRPGRIGFEITETGPLHNGHAKTFRRNLEALKNAGHKLLADDVPMGPDFATRFHLMEPHIDVVKIDKSIVSKLGKGSMEEINPALAGLILEAKSNQIRILAEGLETREDVIRAHTLRIGGQRLFNLGQGYAIGHPRRLTREAEDKATPALPGLQTSVLT